MAVDSVTETILSLYKYFYGFKHLFYERDIQINIFSTSLILINPPLTLSQSEYLILK